MSDNEDNYDGDDFDDVEEDEGLDDLENPEEVCILSWALTATAQRARRMWRSSPLGNGSKQTRRGSLLPT
uniref:RNA polymerase II, I and III subunit F n=1 Tax=Sarcophilus harrisii TaxID=9305 RepID=A0A7N4P680_SARHA